MKAKERKVPIPPGTLRKLSAVARKVGGDFGLRVELGQPGEGSCFDPVGVIIHLDPLDLAEDPRRALFVAGHEGAHRAITPSLRELGLSERRIVELYGRVGFASLLNFVEDPAVNDWMTARYPGLREDALSVFDDFCAGGLKVAFTGEVAEALRALGHIPRFAAFGYQVAHRWHTGQWGIVLDPLLLGVLTRTAARVDEAVSAIPDPAGSSREEVLRAARRRFEICKDHIWPVYRELIEEDLRTTEVVVLLRMALEAERKLAAARRDNRGKKGVGQPASQGISEEELKELRKLARILRGLPEDLLEQLGGFPRSGDAPLPGVLLEGEALRALRRSLDKLPASLRGKVREKAGSLLERLEDRLGEALRGKLAEEPVPTHGEIKERARREEDRRRRERSDEEARELKRRLEEKRQSSMEGYDRIYEEVADQVERLYADLRRFLAPERCLRWKRGFPSGQRADLRRVMQAEKDPRRLFDLWERKTVPTRRDHCFAFLADLSGSMGEETRFETFKGLVIAVEALERLDIPSLVIGFSSECCVFKGLEERLGREQRGWLASMLTWGGESTATHEATRLGAAGLLGHHSRHRFLVTMTDGMPDDPVELERILKRLEWEGKVKVIGLGIGPNTEEVLQQYRASLHLPGVTPDQSEGEAEKESFCDAFSRLLEDLIRHPERY